MSLTIPERFILIEGVIITLRYYSALCTIKKCFRLESHLLEKHLLEKYLESHLLEKYLVVF